MIMVKKAGNASVKSFRSILRIGDIINSPTMNRIGAVAAAGIIKKRGAKNKDKRKRPATVKEVMPVLPPSATPEALSTYEVTVEVPKAAPAVVPTASASSAIFTFGIFPSGVNILAFEHTPTKVPTPSKRSTNRNVKTTTSISNVKI